MDRRAIAEAKIRLERMRPAVTILEMVGLDFAKAESAWWTFLLAASGVYAKLEQGSKASPSSVGWFGRVRHLRKNDPLLRYIHHARNSDEHSLDTSSTRHSGGINILEGGTKTFDSNGNMTIHTQVGVPFRAEVVAPSIKLVPVRDDRFGDTFPVPNEHMGQPIDDPAPHIVARLGMAYLEGLIVEAERLVR